MRTGQTALVLAALGLGLGGGLWVFHANGPGWPPPAQEQAPQRRVLHFFTTTPCAWCERMKVVLQDPAVRAALAPYELHENSNPNAARQYGVEGYPTFIITDGSGHVL